MNLFQYILVLLVRMYRVTLSPVITFLFGTSAACRFEPTCSQYAMEAVKTHGAIRGSWLATKRICRCHPWGGCGEDPVPLKEGRGSRVEDVKLSGAPVFAALRGKKVRI